MKALFRGFCRNESGKETIYIKHNIEISTKDVKDYCKSVKEFCGKYGVEVEGLNGTDKS